MKSDTKYDAELIDEFNQFSIEKIAEVLQKKNSWGKNEVLIEIKQTLLQAKFDFITK